ncbi:MAG: HDOD domain-containing protein [Chitinivibrionales bacterium]|nr:HDOD domain-containing protein [Chitinivibrionales bacterium]
MLTMISSEQKRQLSQKITDLIEQLPPLPDTIAELRRVAANPNVRFSHIAPILKRDSSLCADLLHLVNSAYFGVNHSVDTVDEALRIFGVEPLINFVTLTFSEKVIRERFLSINNVGDYFQHSREISKAAVIVAGKAKMNRRIKDFISTAGLLHDIGRLVILMAQDKSVFELAGNSAESLKEVIENEQDIAGMNHCLVGSLICEKWHLSTFLQNAIKYHHTPLDGGVHTEAAYIFLAHFLTFNEVSDMMLATVLPQDNIKSLGLSPKSIVAAKEEYSKSRK